MKQLTTKKIYAYIVFNRLKSTPPKDFENTDELVSTVDEVLPALEKVSGEFNGFKKQADEINSQVITGKLTQEEGMAKITVLQKEVRQFEIAGGEEMVVAEFETAGLATLVKQFERWGKQWFDKVDDFVNFKKDIAKANQA